MPYGCASGQCSTGEFDPHQVCSAEENPPPGLWDHFQKYKLRLHLGLTPEVTWLSTETTTSSYIF
jgi:hypothetical protein